MNYLWLGITYREITHELHVKVYNTYFQFQCKLNAQSLKVSFSIAWRPSSVSLSVCKLFTISSYRPEPLGQIQQNSLAETISHLLK